MSEYKLNSKHNKLDYEEFQEDYQRFWYLIKLLVIYRNSGEVNVRLMFNHLVILTNNFGHAAAEILMRVAIDKGDYDIIRYSMTILHYVGYIPDDRFMKLIDEEYVLQDIPLSTELLQAIEDKLNEDI